MVSRFLNTFLQSSHGGRILLRQNAAEGARVDSQLPIGVPGETGGVFVTETVRDLSDVIVARSQFDCGPADHNRSNQCSPAGSQTTLE
jgi:hypothetical protein